jgi:hypothetical protein
VTFRDDEGGLYAPPMRRKGGGLNPLSSTTIISGQIIARNITGILEHYFQYTSLITRHE